MNVVLWIVLGAVAGWIAGSLVKGRGQQGLITNVIVGVVGALVGGWIFDLLGGAGVTGFNLYSLLVAVVGAVVLLVVLRAIQK